MTEQFFQEVADRVVQIITERFQSQFEEQRKTADLLQREIESLKADNIKLMTTMDAHEQAARSSNIRILGVPKADNEDVRKRTLEIFTKKLKVNIKDSDIGRCYRVSAKNPVPDKQPAILVSFNGDACRAKVLKNRKELKNSGILIKEDLTKMRLALLNSAIEKFSYKNAWCLNGNIYVKCDSVVHRVNNEQDLDNLL